MAVGIAQWDGNNGSVRVNYTETVNLSAGTSTITVTSVQVMSTSCYGVIFCACGGVYVNGTRVLYMNGGNGYSTGYVDSANSWYTVSNTYCSGVTVSNNGDGESVATISIGPWEGYNDFNVWCITDSSGNITCDTSGLKIVPLTAYETIPGPLVSATTPVVLGDSIEITVAMGGGGTLVHSRLSYSFDNSTWENIPFPLNASSFVWDTSCLSDYFLTETSRICYIKCVKTRMDTSGTIPHWITIGTDITSVYIMATGAPTVSCITVTPKNDNAVIQGWNGGDIFVQGNSTMQIAAYYSLAPFTTLSNCKIAVNGTTISDGDATTFSTLYPITESGTVAITATVTDSHGGTGSGKTSVTVYPYLRPYAFIADAIRYSSDVNVEDKQDGTNISAKATIAYSSVNGYNSAGVKVRYKAAGGVYPDSATTLTSGNANHVKINGSDPVDTNTSYIVQFIIYDSLHTENSDPTTVEVIIPTKAVTIHAKDGGTGIAFGGYNTLDAIELWLNTYLYGKLVVPPSMYGTGDPSTSEAVVGQVYFQLVD